MLQKIKSQLSALATPERKKGAERYFKTGVGQYAHGDQFIGVTVPQLRAVAKEQAQLDVQSMLDLLKSPLHEERLLAAFMLVNRYVKTRDAQERHEIYTSYLAHVDWINNWDLVDCSAHWIVGQHLHNNPDAATILHNLAVSDHLWSRRIAMVATAWFIRHGQYDITLSLARTLLHDTHDLMHKAVGWMLREVGKKDEQILLQFLDLHAAVMPRTMLRYAIEKFSPEQRAWYLQIKK